MGWRPGHKCQKMAWPSKSAAKADLRFRRRNGRDSNVPKLRVYQCENPDCIAAYPDWDEVWHTSSLNKKQSRSKSRKRKARLEQQEAERERKDDG